MAWIHRLMLAAGLMAVSAVLPGDAAGEAPQPAQNAAVQFGPPRKLFFQPLAAPDAAESAPASADAGDYIDARAPRDPPLETFWRSAQDAIDAGDWKRGFEWSQRLLDMPGDAAVRTAAGRWTSLRQVVQARLAAAPRDVRADYERQYGGLAQQLLVEALRTGSLERLAEVATRFLHTRAGADAANALAAAHLDRHELQPAWRWLRGLIDSGADLARNPRWRLKAAYVARDIDPATAQQLIDSLGDTAVEIGGRTMSARKAWETLRPIRPGHDDAATDWRQAFGAPSRRAFVPAGEPLLQAEWRQPLTGQPQVQQRLQELLSDLHDEAAVRLPAAQPLAIADRVAFRTLRGVRVVSAATGQTLWETPAAITPEQILMGLPAGQPGSTEATRMVFQRPAVDNSYIGEMAEFHPLANLLFRDAAYGHISSDGVRLFLLEDLAVLTRNQSGYQWDDSPQNDDPYGLSWSTNRLSAYDLATGREVWTIGGPATEDPFAPPLAGSFFLGAPLAVDDSLYVVASQGEEIRLWRLDPVTGRPRWSQLIAVADTKIERDIARRWLGAAVAAADGILVCPTTVGWLTAVDPVSRSLLWAVRYLPTDEEPSGDPGARFLPQHGLSDQWAPGSPVIAGNAVLYAPPDADELFCLNRLDGSVRWTQPRGAGLYLAGVTDRLVLVAETHGLRACDLRSGETLWHCPWDKSAVPSGRGLIAGDRYVAPLSTRELWFIDLADGQVTQRLVQPVDQPPLGNLIKTRDRWISLGVEGCLAFGEQEQITRELADRLQRQPHDGAAILRSAEIRLLHQDFDGAAQLLTNLPDRLPEEFESRRRSLRWQMLAERAERDPNAGAEVFDELTELSRSPADRLQVSVWRARHLDARGRSLEAFELLRQSALAEIPDWTTRPDAPTVQVRTRAWLSGQMARVYERASDDTKSAIDRSVKSTLQSEAATLPRLAELFDFHPEATRVWWQLAEQRASQRDWTGAEAILARCSEQRFTPAALESRLKLCRLWIDWGLGEDARPVLRQLAARAPDAMLSDGRRLRTAVESLLGELPANADEVGRSRPFPAVHWQAQQSSTTHTAPVQEIPPPLGWPTWRRVTVQIEPQEQRVTFQSASSEAWLWLAPLRMSARGADLQLAPARIVDHRLWVLSRDVLQLLSPFERQVTWTRTLDALSDVQIPREASRWTPPALQDTVHAESGFNTWDRWSSEHGALAVANRRYLCAVGRRELVVLDPLTGAERWKKTGLSPLAMVFGGHHVVYIFQQHRDEPVAEAFRADDGEPLQIPGLAERLSRSLAIRGDDLLLINVRHLWGLKLLPGRPSLQSWNPLTDRVAWSVELPADSQVGIVEGEAGVVVGPQPPGGSVNALRQVQWIDLDDGSVRALAPIALGHSRDGCYPLLDDDRFYLIANTAASQAYHYGDSLPSTPVHGRIAAWERSTGRLLWQRDVAEQHLVLDRFRHSPILLCLSRSWKQQGNSSYTQLNLLALDKQTGQTLYESSAPSTFNGFHGLTVRKWEPSVELRSYNLKLRLSPTP